MSRIDNLVKGYIAPVLKQNSFKKKKLSWNRSRASFIDVIDVQESKGSTTGSERFTLNIGVFVPSFYETVWNEPCKGFAQEADCVVRFRLGALLQENFSGQALDTWWNLETDEDIDKVGSELKSAIESKVLPFMDSMTYFKSLYEFVDSMGGWQQQYPLMQIYFALLKKSLGDQGASLDILNGLVLGNNKAWAARAKQVLAALQ
ncbi:DUF4304 domain-containing protein [Glaciecola siphonariae]|uniref:DUF4304 domain-containing protein n=1 Tax=Glaciecola siphonariae TaxID=521012 RepID=A0ABV9LXK7_9ALTE